MCSVQYLREFIKERLAAVCEEIFSEVQKTIVQYEEEISRQRRLLDISRKPDTKSNITDLPQQRHCEEEEGLDEQQVCNQKRNSSLDQEDPKPPQIKEEQEELCSSQDGEKLGLKQEADTFMVTLTYEESDHSEAEPKQLLSHSSPEVKKRRHHRKRSHSQGVDNAPVSESQSQTGTRKKSLQCNICGKTLHCKYNLTRHLRIHTGEKPYCCNTCGKKFSDSSAFRKHMKIHTGGKPYSCSTCEKTFTDSSALKIHKRIHTGDKPYPCSTCGRRFSILTALKTHLRIHTGEKPYLCSTCGKRFSQGSNLTKHMRIHTGSKFHA